MIEIKDRKFLKYVKNTKNDFMKMGLVNSSVIDSLKNILSTKQLTLLNVMELVQVIFTREENIDYCKEIQDPKTFKIVNEEHRYMKEYILNFFNIDNSLGLIQISNKGEI